MQSHFQTFFARKKRLDRSIFSRLASVWINHIPGVQAESSNILTTCPPYDSFSFVWFAKMQPVEVWNGRPAARPVQILTVARVIFLAPDVESD